MLFDSSQVIETLEKLYLKRKQKMSQYGHTYNSLQTLVLEAELEALNQAVKSDHQINHR